MQQVTDSEEEDEKKDDKADGDEPKIEEVDEAGVALFRSPLLDCGRTWCGLDRYGPWFEVPRPGI